MYLFNFDSNLQTKINMNIFLTNLLWKRKFSPCLKKLIYTDNLAWVATILTTVTYLETKHEN